MYEMQGPRQGVHRRVRLSPDKLRPTGRSAARCSVRPTTGPGHLAKRPVSRPLDHRPVCRFPSFLALPRVRRFPSFPAPRTCQAPGLSATRVGQFPSFPTLRIRQFPGRFEAQKLPSEWYPFSVVEQFYCRSAMPHKGLRVPISRFFSRPQDHPPGRLRYPLKPQVFHRIIHSHRPSHPLFTTTTPRSPPPPPAGPHRATYHHLASVVRDFCGDLGDANR
jgi:hypothetical protein